MSRAVEVRLFTKAYFDALHPMKVFSDWYNENLLNPSYTEPSAMTLSTATKVLFFVLLFCFFYLLSFKGWKTLLPNGSLKEL